MSAETATPQGGHWRAYAMLTTTALCWGANALFSRMAAGEVSPMAVVLLRWVGVAILITLFANRYVRDDWPRLKPKLPFLFAMGALGFAGFNGLFYVAGYYTTAVNIGILQGAIPGIVLFGAFLAHGARITRMQGLGVATTVIGVATVASGGTVSGLAGLGVNPGDGLMIIACVLYAGYTVALRNRPATSALGLFTVLAASALVTSLPMVAVEVYLGQFHWPTPKGWLVVGLITLFPSFLAQIFYMHGVEAIGPGRAGVFVNLVPVFGAVLAVLILNEPFELYHGAALALVLGGIWLSERGKA